MEKDDIEKIDEQIKAMTEHEEETMEENTEASETKVVDNIQDLDETKEEPEEEVLEESEETPPPKEEVEVLKEEEPAPPPKKKTPVVIWILVGGIVLLLLVLLAVLIIRNTGKKADVDKKELTAAEKKQIIQEYGEALQGIINVYLSKSEVLLDYEDAILLVKYDYEVVCDEHEIYEDGRVYLNQCTIDDEEVAYSYGKKQKKEELKEGAIKVYVSKSNGKATLKEPSNLSNYEVYSFDIEGKYSNLSLFGDKTDYVIYLQYRDYGTETKIVNYKTKDKILPDEDYTSVRGIFYNNQYDSNYVVVQKNNRNGVFRVDTGENVVPYIYEHVLSLNITPEDLLINSVSSIDDGVILVKGDNGYGAINYRTNQIIIPIEYLGVMISGKYVLAIDSYNDTHIFETNGHELTFDQYDTIYSMVDGKYILVNDNKHIKLITVTGKELYDYGEYNVGRANYGMNYSGGPIFSLMNLDMANEAIDEGCYEFLYNPNDKTGEVKKGYCGGVAKPILYLYPEKTTKVTVQFERPELLETTYPKYVDRWEVTAKKNGDLTDKNGKKYYALYWDEVKVHSVDFSTGFYVTKDNAIEFLEEKLSYIGFNDREKNEFIMYWLPILEKNGQSLVYFELTEERESYNPIHINPQPDSLLRMVIHVKKVDHKVNIKEEKLDKFHRKGFAAVEWGGTTY